MTDLVTFGETMLRLSPPEGRRLEDMATLDVAVGGAESNVAVVASRFDHDVRWLSRLPDTPLGRRVTGELRRHGVEPAVDWAEAGRLGTYYLEEGNQPRDTNVIYDRARSAFTAVSLAALPTDAVATADLVHTSGITPGLSAATRTATEELLQLATEAGTRTSFDLNYRSKLWDPADARSSFTSLLPYVDVLFAPERDIDRILEIAGTPAEQAQTLAIEYDIETVVVTRGTEGALCRHEGSVFEHPVYETETVDPIGTGDAFVGGFLSCRLSGGDMQTALSYGAASAALKRTIKGDQAVITPEEVRAVIDDSPDGISR